MQCNHIRQGEPAKRPRRGRAPPVRESAPPWSAPARIEVPQHAHRLCDENKSGMRHAGAGNLDLAVQRRQSGLFSKNRAVSGRANGESHLLQRCPKIRVFTRLCYTWLTREPTAGAQVRIPASACRSSPKITKRHLPIVGVILCERHLGSQACNAA